MPQPGQRTITLKKEDLDAAEADMALAADLGIGYSSLAEFARDAMRQLGEKIRRKRAHGFIPITEGKLGGMGDDA